MTSSSSVQPVPLAGPLVEWRRPADPATTALTGEGPVVEDPDGRRLSLPAYREGGEWRARLAVTDTGWRWRWGDAHGLLEPAPAGAWPVGALRLSQDRRSLVDAGGQPFFFLGDTAWSIVWKGRPEEWARYLDRRAAQGYSVLQVNLLPWRWELADVEGQHPFVDGDPERPAPAYFARYDRFLAMAAERGLRVCLMLIWGGPRQSLPAARFSTEQAVAFARFAVARFAAYPMLWSISGDGEYAQEPEKWDEVGAAVEASDPFAHPTTNHLPPSLNWHMIHHHAAWHDFHMLQTGHRRASLPDLAALPAAYHRLAPVKAVVNGEPWYEAHPAMDVPGEYGQTFSAADARRAFWVGLLSGATMGHTYGGQGIWNWKRPGDDEEHLAGPQIGPTWEAALDHAGAEQVALGAAWLRRLPWWRLQPCPERVELEPAPPDYAGQAACAALPDALYLLYLPAGAGRATLKGLAAGQWQVTRLDPRDGAEVDLGPVEPSFERRWTAPPMPSAEDWVLRLTRR